MNSICDEENLNATTDDVSQSRQLSRSSTPLPTSDTCNENTNHHDFTKNTNLNNDKNSDNGETVNDSIESTCTDEVGFEEIFNTLFKCTNGSSGLYFRISQPIQLHDRIVAKKSINKRKKNEVRVHLLQLNYNYNNLVKFFVIAKQCATKKFMKDLALCKTMLEEMEVDL